MAKLDDNTTVQDLYSKSKSALKAGNYDEALELANQALGLEPDNHEIIDLATEIIAKRQQSALADARKWQNIGQTANHAEKFDEAINAFQRVLDLADGNPEVQSLVVGEKIRELLIESRERQNRPGDVARVDELVIAGEYERALEILRDYSDASVGDLRKNVLGLLKLRMDAQAAIGGGNYEGALKLLDQLKKEAPSDPYVKDNLSRAMYGKLMAEGKDLLVSGNLDEAAKKFKEASSAMPTELEPNSKLAEVDQKRIKRREVDMQLAVMKSAIATENFEEAIRVLKSAIEKEPDRSDLFSQMTTLIEQKRKYEVGRAIRLADEGQKYLDAGDFDAANNRFASALRLDESCDAALNGMANLRQMVKKRQDADAAFNTAKDSFNGRDYEAAEMYLQEALEFASDRKGVDELLQKTRLQRILVKARTFLVQRQFPKVKAELDHAQKQFPDHPEVQKLADELYLGRKILDADVAIQGNDYQSVLDITAEVRARFGDLSDERLQELQKTAEHRKKQALDTKTALGKGLSALKMDDYDEAMRLYQVAMDNATVDSDEYNRALEGYTKVIENKNAEAIKKIEARLEQAEKALAERDYDVAIAYVEELEKEQKNNLLGVRDINAELMKRMLEVRGSAARAKAAHERADALIRQGRDALTKGDYEAAISAFSRAEVDDPNAADIKQLRIQTENRKEKAERERSALTKARSALGAQEYAEAWKQAQTVLEINPGHGEALDMQHQAIIQLRDHVNEARVQGQFEDALKFIRQWRSITPNDNEVTDLQRRVEQEQARRMVAEEAYIKAKKAPSDKERVALLEEVMNIDPDNVKARIEFSELQDKLRQRERIERLWEAGSSSEERGDFPRAYGYYKQAVELNPSDQLSHARLDRLERAAREFAEGILEQVNQYVRDARFEDALTAIERVIKATWELTIKEEALEKRRYITNLYKKYREMKSVIQISKTYLERFEFSEAEENLNYSLGKLQEEDKLPTVLSDVVLEIKDIIRKSQENKRIKIKYDTYFSQGQSAHTLKRYDDAIQAFSSAVSEAEKLNINTQTIRAHIEIIQKEKQEQENLVRALLHQANSALAVSDFDKVDNALRQIPENARQLPEYRSLQNRLNFERQELDFSRYYDSGSRYLVTGNYKSAIAQFGEALRIKPDDSKAQADLFEAQYNQNVIDQNDSDKLIENGDRELAKGELILASEYYIQALTKNKENVTAKQKYEYVNDKLDKLRKEKRRNLTIGVLGVIFAVLTISISTFFAADGPRRLAAAIAPTETPTNTPTITPSPTATKAPTVTKEPSATTPATSTPLVGYAADPTYSQILYYSFPEDVGGNTYKGIWGKRFYLCTYNTQFRSYLIAVLADGCKKGENTLKLGWVSEDKITVRFDGDFPSDRITPHP